MTFASALFLLFLALKLTGAIAWSWWLVTLPLWIGAVVFLVFGGLILSLGGKVTRKK